MDLDGQVGNVRISVKEEVAFGLSLGYEIVNNSTVELEFSRSTGIVREYQFGSLSDLTVSTIGLYYTQRLGGDLYFTFTSGMIREDVRFSGASVSNTETDAFGFSWGIGGGYKFTEDLSIEAEYLRVEADLSLLLLSARYAL